MEYRVLSSLGWQISLLFLKSLIKKNTCPKNCPMNNKSLLIIILIASSFIVGKLYLLALKDPTQWTGFYVSTFHVLLSATASFFILRKKKR